MKIKNIFVTGSIGIGKSTVLRRVIACLSDVTVRGFRILSIYDKNQRLGFALDSLEGNNEVFAHVSLASPDRFDIYGFDYRVFEGIGVTSLKHALQQSDVILMDEIGVMEKRAKQFRHMILKCLDAPQLVLGAFQQRATWFAELLLFPHQRQPRCSRRFHSTDDSTEQRNKTGFDVTAQKLIIPVKSYN